MIDWSMMRSKEQIENDLHYKKINEEIIQLKKMLQETDYVVLSDYDKEKNDIIMQRQLWREKIRSLEKEIEKK